MLKNQPTIKFALLTITLILAACDLDKNSPPEHSYAVFDYFEYQGQDSVFNQTHTDPEKYINPVLAGFYPDPSIIQVGSDYYLVNSTFCYFPGLPIFHSQDLVNWTQIGNVINRPGQLSFDGSDLSNDGIYAPAIEYHEGTFYIVSTCVRCGGNFVVTAKNPAGPWSDPVWLPRVGGIDPSLFFDDDGSAWIVNNEEPIGGSSYEGHRALWLQQFDPNKLITFGPRTMIINGGSKLAEQPIWIEGPHIFRRHGKLYLIAAEGGTSVNHSEVVFTAEKVTGPWIPFPENPILTQRHLDPNRINPITSVGHADFVQTPDGQWWATFLGTRPYRDNLYNTGRETYLLPVRWINDWPILTSGKEQIPYQTKRPALARQPSPTIPTSGNFTLREEFDGPLPDYWVMLRTPTEKWYDLNHTPGAIAVKARSDSIGAIKQPSYLGRRQQHMYATVTTSMSFKPVGADDRAGLIALQNDEYYFFLGLQNIDNSTHIVVSRRAGGEHPINGHIIKSRPLSLSLEDPIELRIKAQADDYSFFYRLPDQEWQSLAEHVDGTILSTEIAGGFVGATMGIYAYDPAATNQMPDK